MSEQTARGWQTFGHPGAVRLLSGAVEIERTSHAYLFTGPERTGRKTLAMDLARAVNCIPVPDLFGNVPLPPCGACSPCDRIARSLYADVRVIDVDTPLPSPQKASGQGSAGGRSRNTIGIEHVGELQREASLKPFEGRCRVFIIDGAETMTPEAANRLLKTLEEPADSVLIVLVAPSSTQLPQTVVSRCQHVKLRLVAAGVIERMLVERFNAGPDTASALARAARGRPGWAIDALRDPTAMDRRNQTALRIFSALTGDIEERFRYARDVSSTFRRDRAAAMDEIGAWLEWWRDVAFAAHGLHEQVINTDWLTSLSAIAALLDTDAVARSAHSVELTLDALWANAMPQLALEVMMLDLPGVDPSAVPAPATASAEADGGSAS